MQLLCTCEQDKIVRLFTVPYFNVPRAKISVRLFSSACMPQYLVCNMIPSITCTIPRGVRFRFFPINFSKISHSPDFIKLLYRKQIILSRDEFFITDIEFARRIYQLSQKAFLYALPSCDTDDANPSDVICSES